MISFINRKPAFLAIGRSCFGRIILAGSTAAVFGNPGQANYTSAMLGIFGLMNVMKIERAKYNFKANTICPAAATVLTKELLRKEISGMQDIGHIVPMTFFFIWINARSPGIYILRKHGNLY